METTIETTNSNLVATIPPPWGQVAPLLDRPLKLKAPLPAFYSVGHRQAVELNIHVLQCALHWAIKHKKYGWSTKHKIPSDFTLNLRKATEQMGAWLAHIQHLCNRCHNHQISSRQGSQYADPTEWFYRILAEFYFCTLDTALLSLYSIDESQLDRKGDKGRRFIRLHNEICSRAKARNLLNGEGQDLAFGQLLTVAIKIAGQPSMDVFAADYRDFIKAWRGMIREKEAYGHSHDLDTDGSLWRQMGRGRHKQNLTPEYVEILDHQKSC